MEEIVLIENNQAVTNSLLVAKTFGRKHKHVLETIRSIKEGAADFSANPLFEESTYTDPQNGKAYPMFIMGRDGFTLLAMGFTGKKALEFKMNYINAFNKMENIIKSRMGVVALPDFSNPADAARAWAEQYEQRQIECKRADEAEQQVLELTNEIEAMQPKVSYYDTILKSRSTVTTTQIAQDYGMSAVKLNKILEELRVQHKVNGQWILYAPYIGKGYVHSMPVDIVRSNGIADVVMNTTWTQKGRLFLYEGLKNHGILPKIEQL